ncbi:hypothetical protein [Bradyrhizobium iriomotense]|uniref:hypothetical protein n=1 Tax=Bradyrhizobium iriomotense TaxID=441950 RepID=UPI001B89F65A|nr:hypothetical protein [Bradyrhizobium iriomotense]MBR0781065.1 hypothetical protein [Bradyrhizobium iriomotense]
MIPAHARAFALTLLLPVCVLGACGNSHAGSSEPGRLVILAQNTSAARSKHTATPTQPLSESDRISLDMVSNACKTQDYRTFFNAFASSKAVRQKYSAAEVRYAVLGPRGEKISERTFDAPNYPSFPVKMQDYHYKPAKPSRAGDADEYLDLQFNQSQSNDLSVEWSRIHYDGQSSGGDGIGNPLDANGKPIPKGTHPDPEGQLLFHPTADCWEFAEDTRWERKK